MGFSGLGQLSEAFILCGSFRETLFSEAIIQLINLVWGWWGFHLREPRAEMRTGPTAVETTSPHGKTHKGTKPRGPAPKPLRASFFFAPLPTSILYQPKLVER